MTAKVKIMRGMFMDRETTVRLASCQGSSRMGGTEENDASKGLSSSTLAFISVGGDFGRSMKVGETDHSRRAEDAQDEILRAMSPGRRLQVAQGLYETAWQLKAAGLRREHPDWPEERVMGKLRRVFVTGYAGA